MATKLDRYEFIWKAIQVHGYKYDYKKVVYISYQKKICIICPEHGEFYQTPNSHVYRKQGCKKCSDIKNGENRKNTTNAFIKKAKEQHNDKYDYSKSEYNGCKEKICIICPEHGEFWQSPNHHLQGEGCPKCKAEKLSFCNTRNNNDFIKISNTVHNHKYDYSKVNYKNCKHKVDIVCPTHGNFYQTPDAHIRNQGCPICNESKSEKEIAKTLDEHGILYERQKHFEWLGRQSLDFYLPLYQIAIECQGEQHFRAIDFGKIHDIDNQEKLDIKKYKLCCENNLMLLYYVNTDSFHEPIKINDMNKTLYNKHNTLFSVNDLMLS